MSRRSADESDATLLRTTADDMAFAACQLEWCAKKWPEYLADATRLRELAERIEDDARGYGYIKKGK